MEFNRGEDIAKLKAAYDNAAKETRAHWDGLYAAYDAAREELALAQGRLARFERIIAEGEAR